MSIKYKYLTQLLPCAAQSLHIQLLQGGGREKSIISPSDGQRNLGCHGNNSL